MRDRKTSQGVVDEYERSAREAEYGDDGDGPSGCQSAITVFLIVLLLTAFTASC